ncbi:HamA C-terminal domain-containing protein [Lactococcus garvieae]
MSKEFTKSFDDSPLHVYYIKLDLEDDGTYSPDIQKFSDELFYDLPSFAFGSKQVEKVIQDETSKGVGIAEVIQKLGVKSARMLYDVSEMRDAIEYYKTNPVEDKYLKKGEFGELLLYHFLKEYHNTDNLISKIYFKDTANMPAHGFDAVHLDVENKTIWLGESKLYKDKNSAMTALAGDVEEHFNRNFFNSEFMTITNRVKDENLVQDEWVRKIIDPDTETFEKLAKINIALFAGFDSKIFENYSPKLSGEFLEKLKKEVSSLQKSFEDKNKSSWKDDLNIYLIFFPMVSKNDVVSHLHKKLIGRAM